MEDKSVKSPLLVLGGAGGKARALCSLCLHVSSANTRRRGCTRAGHLFFEVERNPKAFIQRVQITAKSSPPL